MIDNESFVWEHESMKNALRLAFIMIFGFLAPSHPVHASTPAAVEKWTPVCLEKVIHCAEAPNQNCLPVTRQPVEDSSHWPHRAQIDVRAVKIPADQRIIFLECIKPVPRVDLNSDGEDDWFCTSGYDETDRELFCGGKGDSDSCVNHKMMNATPEVNYGLAGDIVTLPDGSRGPLDNSHNYFFRTSADLNDGSVFQIINPQNQLEVDSSGQLNASYIEAQSFSVNAFRKYILYYTGKTPQVTPTGTAGIGGQQQATLSFEELREVVENQCSFTNVAWDPYGRVFDTYSLEPIPGVSVQLLQMNPQGEFSAGFANTRNRLIINPFITGSGGDFVFYVEDGDYHLRPSQSGYVMPFQSQWTPTAQAQAIYTDFYFTDSPAIQQRGAIEHRDIPFIPSDGVGKYYDLSIISSESYTDSQGNLVFSGIVSHPFAEVIIETCRMNQGVEVCDSQQVFGRTTGGADKEGAFSITLDQSELRAGEYFKRSFRKVNLLTLTVDPQAPLQESSPLQPLPSYLEGYAYDSEGNLLTSGFVGLYLVSLPVPQEIVPINSDGYFQITSERIPKQPYFLRYLRQNGAEYEIVDEITIAQFLELNKDFLAVESDIDLFTPVTERTNPRRNVTPQFSPASRISPVTGDSDTGSESPQPIESDSQSATPAQNPMLLVGAIILLLIGGAGALLAVYIYKKRASEGI